jgi:CheY-like chemotaxis protein
VNNEAISVILEHLCNEARNSVHASCGVMDLLRDVLTDPAQRASVEIGRASADQLLRSIDDVRELLSSAPPAPGATEEFDLALYAAEVIEVLNLVSAKRRRHMLFDAPAGPLMLRQSRRAVEQVLTRVLDTAFKLTPVSDVHVRLTVCHDQPGARLAITIRDAGLAESLTKWVNADLEEAVLQDPVDVPFAVSVMVAGKRLRALGGWAELVHDAARHFAVVLTLPSHSAELETEELPSFGREAQPDTLSILVAEDSDESFALIELELRDEHVRRARDGREALHMIQRQRFDVVFMDVHMPGVDGYAGIRAMRDWETQTGNARTPIVVLSSDDVETQRLAAAKCGCSGFLRKPLHLSDLMNLLERLRLARMPVV